MYAAYDIIDIGGARPGWQPAGRCVVCRVMAF
jgi:hypothetical protein